MTLTLWYHPFSSYSMKAVIALREAGLAFDAITVDLSDAESRDAFYAVWPIGQFPVIRDEATGEVIPESTIIADYAATLNPASGLIPADPGMARVVRLWDRFFDNHIHNHMQRIVADRLRPKAARDAQGVAEARARIFKAYGVLEAHMTGREWAAGDGFTLADCAAAPALHYAFKVAPWVEMPAVASYMERLYARPSFARVMADAEPFAQYFPQE